ncbi:histidine protein methyltransferase [Pseudoscourfieldia marina]
MAEFRFHFTNNTVEEEELHQEPVRSGEPVLDVDGESNDRSRATTVKDTSEAACSLPLVEVATSSLTPHDEESRGENNHPPFSSGRQRLAFDVSSTTTLDMYAAAPGQQLDSAAQQLTRQKAAHDRVRGVYEGGLTIWECSRDLVRTLGQAAETVSCDDGKEEQQQQEEAEEEDGKGVRILELGCGHALPGVAAAKLAAARTTDTETPETETERKAKRRRRSAERKNEESDTFAAVARVLSRGAPLVLHLQDYNEVALRLAAKPAVRWNLDNLNVEVRYFSGVWCTNGVLPANGQCYHLVLSSECTYEVSDVPVLVETALACLARRGGVWLDASKAHYFGVGGGADELRRVLAKRDDVRVDDVELPHVPGENVRRVTAIRWL